MGGEEDWEGRDRVTSVWDVETGGETLRDDLAVINEAAALLPRSVWDVTQGGADEIWVVRSMGVGGG